ncbi:hypothetical protein BU24DRAFT_365793 [Aaosphaeria arxii CBS 175.79]|uniref:Snf7-domain-containing protein n=1 Tax=Aaosphaeria arxii CBS 175.79 TaxID=1450172 RepID=A0A6A5Y3G3_9PLEO|nr:uncharacterized protein BU24DRAFT_365793 [Aaosphaeria arxii CBS 175.79]KAF2020008.1 hypothetical protein BU24DRAFT_365793 [Aaosphaeria arxii CBS 175.79]
MSNLLDFILNYEEAFKSRNRLASLYADFRNQLNTNPDGYHANIAAWKKALADAARAGVIPSQGGNTKDLLNIRTGQELARALQHPNFGQPTCLSAVFHDAVSKKEFLPLQDFLNSQESIYKTSWVPSPWAVVKWGLRTLGVLGQPGFGDKLGTGSFVVLSNVETAAEEILKQMAAQTSDVDRVLSRKDFLKRFSNVLNPISSLSPNDLNILLVHLARDKQSISYDAQTIKFKSENDQTPQPITQIDSAIANLRDQIAKLNSEIHPLEEKVATADITAREAVRNKMMTRAKAALRSKKLAESALEHRLQLVLQFGETYAKMQQAVDQVEIVKAMEASAVALKSLNNRVGGTEGVTKVVDTLRAEMDTTDEINTIINESGAPVDETEIDDEFEALERAEKEREEAEEAAKTAARLAELEQAEQQRKEKEKEREAAKDTKEEQAVEETSVRLSQMSFKEDVNPEAEKEQEKTAIPA